MSEKKGMVITLDDLKDGVDPINKIICGDCIEAMREIPDNYVDTVITDPPYELGFMGKKWDSSGIAFQVEVWKEVLRISKPGAMLLAFGGTRTYHRLTCAIEDAGWEIRDCILWVYGSGFPKSYDISKGIDKMLGCYLEGAILPSSRKPGVNPSEIAVTFRKKTATNPQSEEAKLWNGWDTGLKPAVEMITVAMKPLEGTFAQNALEWGVAGFWIDGGRVLLNGERPPSGSAKRVYKNNKYTDEKIYGDNKQTPSKGRYPANLILDEEAARMLDEQVGTLISKWSKSKAKLGEGMFFGDRYAEERRDQCNQFVGDSGGPSRFFYVAKASRSEREKGLIGYIPCVKCGGLDTLYHIDKNGNKVKCIRNDHPTVKPLELIEYLCKLTMTPTKGIAFDLFLGSGTTAVAAEKLDRKWIGIEINSEYCKIAEKRILDERKQLRLDFNQEEKTVSTEQLTFNFA